MMSFTGPLEPESGIRVAKNSTGAPRDRWFSELYGRQWQAMPVGEMLQVENVSSMVPEFGGPVVHLVTIHGSTRIVVPKDWFTSTHFRRIPNMSGQQPDPFVVPAKPRRS